MSVLLVPGEDLAHFPRRLALILVLLVPKVLEAVDEEVGDAFSWFASLFQTMITRSFAILASSRLSWSPLKAKSFAAYRLGSSSSARKP